MSHADAIKNNNKLLLRCTTINLYVIDSLRAEDVLDEDEESDLKTEKNPRKQRILLFQWLKDFPSDKYESFLKVMKDTEQEHVANLLTGRTDENHLPLSNARYTRLEKIRNKMAKATEIDTEVLTELRSLKAISDTDDDEIRAETVGYKKISKLISAIMRRSNHSYNSFQEVLRKTCQQKAANFLNEGEMPAVHVNNNRPDLDGPLSLAFNDVIKNKTPDDANISELLAEINKLGLDPVITIPGQSIVIFFYCKTIDSAVKFTQIFNSGRLQYIVEGILNRLLLVVEPHNKKTLDSSISLEDDDVISLEEFTGIEGCVREGPTRPNPLDGLSGRDVTTQTDEQTIIQEFTEEHESRIRRHYKKLLTYLSVPDVVAQMFQMGRLTAKEFETIRQFHSTPIRANEELLNIVIMRPRVVYECFLESVKNTKQHHAYQMLTSDEESVGITEDHEIRIRRHYDQLLSNLNVPDVVTQMFRMGKLTAREHEHVRQFHSTPIRASEELLNIIIRNSRDVYECFLESLKRTKQNHVYQMLTPDEESVAIGEQSVTEHSRLIRQNYVWLTEKLDLDSGLLSTLYAKEVLNQREYGQIAFEMDRFVKNEILLSLISRKSVDDFKKFITALYDTSQGHIAKRLTETPVDFLEKRFLSMPESHLIVCKAIRREKHQIKKQSLEYLEAILRKLPNELQTEVSTKILLLHKKTKTDSIWNITFTKTLQESRNIKMQNILQAKAADENCERLMQEIIQREREFRLIKEDIQRENTKTKTQLRELQERSYELEGRLNAASNENNNLLAELKKSEVEVQTLKVLLNQRQTQEDNEKVNIITKLEGQVIYFEINLMKMEAQLRETRATMIEKDLALNTTTRNLEETQEKLKETETKLTEFEAKLIATEKGTDNLNSEEVEAKFFDVKQNFEEARTLWTEERKEFMKQVREGKQESSDAKVSLFDLKQKLEEERKVWNAEKEQLIKQTHEMQQNFQETFGSLLQELTQRESECRKLREVIHLERMIKKKQQRGLEDRIFELEERLQWHFEN